MCSPSLVKLMMFCCSLTGMHIGFSFQFQFTVVSGVNRLLPCEYMFVALGIHCKHGCLDCQEGIQAGQAGWVWMGPGGTRERRISARKGVIPGCSFHICGALVIGMKN